MSTDYTLLAFLKTCKILFGKMTHPENYSHESWPQRQALQLQVPEKRVKCSTDRNEDSWQN